MSSIIDRKALLTNHFGAAPRHTCDELLKVLCIELISVALDFFEKLIFVVPLPLSHSAVKLAPQVFDWVQIGGLSGPFQTADFLIAKIIATNNRRVLRVAVLLEYEVFANESATTRTHLPDEDLAVEKAIHDAFDAIETTAFQEKQPHTLIF